MYSILTQYTRYVRQLHQITLYSSFRSPTWRAPFFFAAGLSALTVLLGWLVIEPDTHHLDASLDRRVDWIGAALVTGGLVLLVFSLGDGESAPQGWKTGCTSPFSSFILHTQRLAE